jgi:hypothetical protein
MYINYGITAVLVLAGHFILDALVALSPATHVLLFGAAAIALPLVEIANAREERRLCHLPLHFEGEERESVRNGKEDARSKREGERALDPVPSALPQHPATAPAARRASFGNGRLVMEQVTVRTGDPWMCESQHRPGTLSSARTRSMRSSRAVNRRSPARVPPLRALASPDGLLYDAFVANGATDAAARLRAALDLFATGEAMMRETLRRQHPNDNDDEIEERLCRWLGDRPGAELGDAVGVAGTWPRSRA